MGSPGVACFPWAAQPDTVLAYDRDGYYVNTALGERIGDLLEYGIGARRVQLLLPEIRLLASCLYYGLTNLSGKQTLGQEYCDILPVQAPALKGGGTAAPKPFEGRARKLYVLFTLLLPYSLARARDGPLSVQQLRDPFGRAAAAAAGRGSGSSSRSSSSSSSSSSGSSSATGGRDSVCRGERIRQLIQYCKRLWALVLKHRRLSLQVLEWCSQVHLMLFFLDGGRFYTLAMRKLGIRFMYNRAVREPRSSYSTLGVLLLVRLCAQAATTVGSELCRLRRESRGEERLEEPTNQTRVPAGKDLLAPHGSRESVSQKKCPLCMSRRENPAATPCGHIFCWDCIIAAAEANSECPLCRQQVLPQTVILLQGYV